MARLIDADRLLRDPYFQKDRWPESHLIRIAVRGQPTVDAVEVVHGRWIMLAEFCDRSICTQCSVCGEEYTYKIGKLENIGAEYAKYNYCPNCGARMDGGKDNGC